ncbi:hypothetical protein [Nitratireductor indicus]|uniref:Uncharacterized protein n=1 Tax=Nitratireductor indicus C115 TaxID=1231190 RepID=K2PN33_9HYPH|nr:hypothetical protein [Nitratireductor indicus]EKF42492.1 hypothetical protein NA8A_10533 [Nitratireductor indicus C115]MDS1137981.1 hypothetical protein [Nitratireductor indicus]SFQ56572.1 hypothetical protein SAMN05216176_106139 [Nitratireductor indicus]
MMKHIRNALSDAQNDAHIDALLSPQEDVSIVDSLYAVAGDQFIAQSRDVLDNVVLARLQARLARRMREVIEQPNTPAKNSRSAA